MTKNTKNNLWTILTKSGRMVTDKILKGLMKKRWVVFFVDEHGKLEKTLEVESLSKAISYLRIIKNAHHASYTAAKNLNCNTKITISRKMAQKAAYLSEGEFRLPKNCKYGPEWM